MPWRYALPPRPLTPRRLPARDSQKFGGPLWGRSTENQCLNVMVSCMELMGQGFDERARRPSRDRRYRRARDGHSRARHARRARAAEWLCAAAAARCPSLCAAGWCMARALGKGCSAGGCRLRVGPGRRRHRHTHESVPGDHQGQERKKRREDHTAGILSSKWMANCMSALPQVRVRFPQVFSAFRTARKRSFKAASSDGR